MDQRKDFAPGSTAAVCFYSQASEVMFSALWFRALHLL